MIEFKDIKEGDYVKITPPKNRHTSNGWKLKYFDLEHIYQIKQVKKYLGETAYNAVKIHIKLKDSKKVYYNRKSYHSVSENKAIWIFVDILTLVDSKHIEPIYEIF